MAFEYSPDGKPQPFDRPMLHYRLPGILRTGGREAARGWRERRYAVLIKADGEHQQPSCRTLYGTHRATWLSFRIRQFTFHSLLAYPSQPLTQLSMTHLPVYHSLWLSFPCPLAYLSAVIGLRAVAIGSAFTNNGSASTTRRLHGCGLLCANRSTIRASRFATRFLTTAVSASSSLSHIKATSRCCPSGSPASSVSLPKR